MPPILVNELTTARLRLRGWRPADRAPFAALNGDPAVMEHFPGTLSTAESNGLAGRIAAGLDERGWGLWAVEVTATGAFAGFVGINPVTMDAPFSPAVEAGWRLAGEHWGLGYATEAAGAALDFGLDVVGLTEIVAFTSTTNLRSQRVMQGLGMRRDPADDFDHPALPPGHRLRRHVLYRTGAGRPR